MICLKNCWIGVKQQSRSHSLNHSYYIFISFNYKSKRQSIFDDVEIYTCTFEIIFKINNVFEFSQLQNDIYTIHILINYKREGAFVYNKIIWFINKEQTKTSSETIIEDFLNISQNVILDIYTVSNAQWFYFLRITVT